MGAEISREHEAHAVARLDASLDRFNASLDRLSRASELQFVLRYVSLPGITDERDQHHTARLHNSRANEASYELKLVPLSLAPTEDLRKTPRALALLIRPRFPAHLGTRLL